MLLLLGVMAHLGEASWLLACKRQSQVLFVPMLLIESCIVMLWGWRVWTLLLLDVMICLGNFDRAYISAVM